MFDGMRSLSGSKNRAEQVKRESSRIVSCAATLQARISPCLASHHFSNLRDNRANPNGVFVNPRFSGSIAVIRNWSEKMQLHAAVLCDYNKEANKELAAQRPPVDM